MSLLLISKSLLLVYSVLVIRPVSRQVLLVHSFDVIILYTVAHTHAAIE